MGITALIAFQASVNDRDRVIAAPDVNLSINKQRVKPL